MTHLPPVGAGNPDPLDLDAAEQLERNEDGRLPLVRARAEKWIGGVTALSGVLGTALVIKGPDTATDIPLGWRVAAACALGAALLLLAAGTYWAYQAAFGEPGALREIQLIPLTGLHGRLVAARRIAAAEALRRLAAAVRAVFAAVALIASAVAITWFASSGAAPPSDRTICVYVNGQLAARLGGSTITVREVPAGASVSACR